MSIRTQHALLPLHQHIWPRVFARLGLPRKPTPSSTSSLVLQDPKPPTQHQFPLLHSRKSLRYYRPDFLACSYSLFSRGGRASNCLLDSFLFILALHTASMKSDNQIIRDDYKPADSPPPPSSSSPPLLVISGS